MPIYFGMPNIHDYFDPRSLILLDPKRPDKAINIIEKAIAEDAWSTALPYIREARQKILNDYHIYASVEKILAKDLPQTKELIALKSHQTFDFSSRQKFSQRIRNSTQKIKAFLKR